MATKTRSAASGKHVKKSQATKKPKETVNEPSSISRIRIDLLAEAVRRIAKDQNVTEEQNQEILWLIDGKDPEAEWAKFSQTRQPNAGTGGVQLVDTGE